MHAPPGVAFSLWMKFYSGTNGLSSSSISLALIQPHPPPGWLSKHATWFLSWHIDILSSVYLDKFINLSFCSCHPSATFKTLRPQVIAVRKPSPAMDSEEAHSNLHSHCWDHLLSPYLVLLDITPILDMIHPVGVAYLILALLSYLENLKNLTKVRTKFSSLR